jgi:hypothetical protein
LTFSESPHLRGLLNDPRQLRQQALFYLVRFFSRRLPDSPALVMLDDLQWADSGSLDALQYLFTNLQQETPLMALAVTRPTLFERYPNWARDVNNTDPHSPAPARAKMTAACWSTKFCAKCPTCPMPFVNWWSAARKATRSMLKN